jgi:D-3-phosphoglycerate dehydrogenase
MSKPKILIYAPREEPPDVIGKLKGTGCDIVEGQLEWQSPNGQHEDAFAEAARDVVALMGTSIRCTPISRRIMEGSQRLRVVAKYTVGVDDIDVDAATELGIMVCHAPTEANCFGVAEQTVAMILAMLKKVQVRDTDVRAGLWREMHHATTFAGRRLSDDYPGITIGLVGLGRIGTRVAQLLAPWRIRLIAHDPHIPPARFLLAGVENVDYDTLLRQSDVVSFHVVLTKETRFMFAADEIAKMKPGGIVVNTARGKVIREADVAKAIANGHLGGAAIDAFEVEPLPMDSPLRSLGHKVLFSPHSAAFNDGGQLQPGVAWAARAVVTALGGGVPDNVYNHEVLPRWRERFGGMNVAGA